MPDNLAVEYVDASMLDGVRRRRSMHNDNDHSITEQERSDGIPEELMSKLETYIGDGSARVTVSGELASSHEFHKASAFVSISVTCNNDLDDIETVHNLVRPVVQELAHKDHEDMSRLRDTILPKNKKKHSNPTGLPGEEKLTKPPAKMPAGRSSKVITKNKGIKKPSFRR